MSPPGCFALFRFLFLLPYSLEGAIQTYTVHSFFEEMQCDRFPV